MGKSAKRSVQMQGQAVVQANEKSALSGTGKRENTAQMHLKMFTSVQKIREQLYFSRRSFNENCLSC